MLVKTLTVRQFATVKRVAQNVNPLVVKRSKLFAKIEELNEEIAAINEEVSGHEMGIKALTGGMTSEQLVNKLVEDTGKTDKDGKPIKVTKYEPKEGTVVFNANDNVYEIYVEESTINITTPEERNDTKKVSKVDVKIEEEAQFNPIAGFNIDN